MPTCKQLFLALSMLLVTGASFVGCATTQESSEWNKLMNQKAQHVVDRNDQHLSQRLNR